MQHPSQPDRFSHHIIPPSVVVFIAREAIDEELGGGPALILHGSLDQATRDGHRHDLALIDDLLDELSVFRPAGALGSQEVAC